MRPTSWPSYKKKEDRKELPVENDDWIEDTYRLKFKTAWYKRGLVKKRIPGFTDRVLYYL